MMAEDLGVNKDMIPMFNELKKRNIKIRLISDYFSEEVKNTIKELQNESHKLLKKFQSRKY